MHYKRAVKQAIRMKIRKQNDAIQKSLNSELSYKDNFICRRFYTHTFVYFGSTNELLVISFLNTGNINFVATPRRTFVRRLTNLNEFILSRVMFVSIT